MGVVGRGTRSGFATDEMAMALAGAVSYLLVTGGFPYTGLMLLLLIAWLSIKSLVQTRNIFSILPLFIGVVLGFGLSAPA